MKKWKFNLESVRELKTKIEEQAAQKHARALMTRAKAKSDLAQTENELNAAALLQFSNQGRASAKDLQQLNDYMLLLEKQRKERLDACLRAEKDAALTRAALEKAARDREILQKVHDKRRSEYEFELGREEQKWIDELAGRSKQGLLTAL